MAINLGSQTQHPMPTTLYAVVEAAETLLSPLDQLIHDCLIEEHGCKDEQLIWESLASTYVDLDDDYTERQKQTIKESVVYLAILDESIKGKVKHIILGSKVAEDLQKLLKSSRLTCSKLPSSFSAESSPPEIKRALFGVVKESSKRPWNKEVVNPREAQTRGMTRQELNEVSTLAIGSLEYVTPYHLLNRENPIYQQVIDIPVSVCLDLCLALSLGLSPNSMPGDHPTICRFGSDIGNEDRCTRETVSGKGYWR